MGGRMRMGRSFLFFFLLILVSLEVECYVWVARLELIFYFFLFFHFYVRFNLVRQWKRVVPRTVLMFIDREETHSQLSLLRKQHATDFKWNNHHLWNFWLEKMVDKVKFVLKNDSAWILQVLAAFSHHHNQRMNRFNLKRKCTVQLLSGFHGSFNRPYLLLLVGLTIQGNDCHVDKMM